jgi:uroporphyrinogen decarboxylase
MTGRERILTALNHKEPDRVPLDIGVGRACSITITAYENLTKYLGIKVDKVESANTTGLGLRTADVDERVYKKLGVNLRPIRLKKPSNWNLEINEDESSHWFIDEWRCKYRMPKGGFYYDMVEFPLSKINLDDYVWPDPSDPGRFEGVEELAEYYINNSDSVLVYPECLGNGFLQMGAHLFGFDRWFTMLATDINTVEKFLNRYLELKIQFWDAVLSRLGNRIDVVCEGDDLGTQKGPWISLNMYRKMIKPMQEKLFSFIKKKAGVKLFYHSCGSIYQFIPDLIEIGVDILNPIQYTASQMNAHVLKKEFGNDLVFWGGGIDTQKILPFGTKQEIVDEVKRNIEYLAPGGGFIFAAVHDIQDDVPPQNIITMVEALEIYGKS